MAVEQLVCEKCAAPLPPVGPLTTVLQCGYCGATLKIDASVGAVLLRADLTTPSPPGWHSPHTANLSAVYYGPEPALYARFPSGGTAPRQVLASVSTLDDIDARVTLRMHVGDPGNTYSGLYLRMSKEGHLGVFVSMKGSLLVYSVRTGQPRRELLPWTFHPAVERTPGAPNHLRVSLVNDRIRVLINGQLVTSARDATNTHGYVSVGMSSSGHHEIAVSNLMIWEPSAEERAAAGPRVAPAPAPSPSIPNDVLAALNAFQPQSTTTNASAPAGAMWSISLDQCGPNKIMVIKHLREVLKCGLAEAKNLADRAPTTLPFRADHATALTVKQKLEAAGAKVSLTLVS